jgi:preprotein translocase subunit SecF
MDRMAKFGNDLYTGARSYNFVGRRKIWYIIAAVMLLASVLLPIARGGFVFGIEFRGGSEFQVGSVEGFDGDSIERQDLATETVNDTVEGLSPHVTTIGDSAVRVQTDQLTSDQSAEVRDALAEAFSVDRSEVTASFIGPSWGADITSAAVRALVIFVILAGIVMALYFRTWKMSLAAIIALVHDIVITAGVYGALGFEITRRLSSGS